MRGVIAGLAHHSAYLTCGDVHYHGCALFHVPHGFFTNRLHAVANGSAYACAEAVLPVHGHTLTFKQSAACVNAVAQSNGAFRLPQDIIIGTLKPAHSAVFSDISDNVGAKTVIITLTYGYHRN